MLGEWLVNSVLWRKGDAAAGGWLVRKRRKAAALELINKDLKHRLVEAGNVIINLTGGTTVKRYVVERIGEAARRLGCQVRRIALIDRRPAEEQRA